LKRIVTTRGQKQNGKTEGFSYRNTFISEMCVDLEPYMRLFELQHNLTKFITKYTCKNQT